ncbi:MAG TPA: PIN domain-containing protein [Acidimicrobiales bacterium]|nr:PIN domain-containing protein [Acidimicrobiales bacterium]
MAEPATRFLALLAVGRLYRPLWSSAVLAELGEHEELKLVRRGVDPKVARVRASRLVEQMTAVFEDALVEGWQELEGSYGLPDADDEHIVAAAVVAGAHAIVTNNTKDFPSGRPAIRPCGVRWATAHGDSTVAGSGSRAARARPAWHLLIRAATRQVLRQHSAGGAGPRRSARPRRSAAHSSP